MDTIKNLIEVTTNKLLNDIVDTAVSEALILQQRADREGNKQEELKKAGQLYDYTMKNTIQQGVHAVCEVLWRIFGGCIADSIAAIEKIAAENKSSTLGYDCQDYVALFMEAFNS